MVGAAPTVDRCSAGSAAARAAGPLVRQELMGWYLRPDMGASQLFEALNAQKAAYVLIGGYDHAPASPASEIRLLIADEDIGALDQLLVPTPLGRPVEVYSTTGLPGFGFDPVPGESAGRIAAFPPRLTKNM